MRERVVTSLAAEVAEAAAATPFEFLELSGAVKGYADGRPTGGPAPEIAWQLGVDVDAAPAPATGSRPSATRPTPSASAAISTRTATPPLGHLPAGPPTATRPNLREKVALARARGLRRVDFYHYGLMRLDALDWIHAALTP